jgi:hypothetical protein
MELYALHGSCSIAPEEFYCFKIIDQPVLGILEAIEFFKVIGQLET